MRKKNRRSTAPGDAEAPLEAAGADQQPVPVVTPAMTQPSAPTLPVLPRLVAGERVVVRTEDDEVRASARAKAIRLLASRDALSDPDLKYRHAPGRAYAADVIAEALGFTHLSLRAPSTEAVPSGLAVRDWVAPEATQAAPGASAVLLDAAALCLPVVSPRTCYDDLVASFGYRFRSADHVRAQTPVFTDAQAASLPDTDPLPTSDVPSEFVSLTEAPAPVTQAPVEPVAVEPVVVEPVVVEPVVVVADTPTPVSPVVEAESVEDEPVWTNVESVGPVEQYLAPAGPAAVDVTGDPVDADVAGAPVVEVTVPPVPSTVPVVASVEADEPVWTNVESVGPVEEYVAAEQFVAEAHEAHEVPAAIEPPIEYPTLSEDAVVTEDLSGAAVEATEDPAGDQEPVWATTEEIDPDWQDVVPAPMSPAEQEAYDSLMADLRAFSDLPPIPPVPPVAGEPGPQDQG